MNAIESWVIGVVGQPRVHAVLHAIYSWLLPPFLQPHTRHAAASPIFGIPFLALSSLERIAHSYLWFLAMGLVMYALLVRKSGRSKAFSYVLLNREPGQKFSFWGGLKYLVPKSLYSHRSVKVDAMYWPISLILNSFGLLGATVGVGVVQVWLLHRLGHSPVSIIPAGGFAIFLEVVIVLLARDFGRFMWHWQGHVSPFFWEFHKGHHSVEVLHPFFIRTHPVDMFIRNAYTGAGGGLIAGSLIYLLGMNVNITALSWAASFTACADMLQWFEHSHVRISFGKTLDRYLYAPFMHHIHHGAALEHMNKNLGITGGLIVWDYLFGTLYRPSPGEKIIWGASMDELGENNPHKTLWGFLSGPFIGAVQVLRGRTPAGAQPMPAAGSTSSRNVASTAA